MSERKKASGETKKSTRASKKGSGEANAAPGKGAKWGRVLRTAYDDALREPVPDEFLDLLGKLD